MSLTRDLEEFVVRHRPHGLLSSRCGRPSPDRLPHHLAVFLRRDVRTLVTPEEAQIDLGPPRVLQLRPQTVIIEPDYRGYRIEVLAQPVDGAWDAEVRVRRTLSDQAPHIETVTCRKPAAGIAEEKAAIYARRWIDRRIGSVGR